MEQSRIDWPSFIASIVIILGVCIPLALFSDWAGIALQSLYDYIASEFGIAYLLASVAAIGLYIFWKRANALIRRMKLTNVSFAAAGLGNK